MIERMKLNIEKQKAESTEQFFNLAISLGLYSNKERLATHIRFLFGDKELFGNQILDIGGGSGLLSFYAASQGADVVCLEPENDGSTQGMTSIFKNFKMQFTQCLGEVTLKSNTLQDFATRKRFQLVLAANSINHIDEKATEQLHESIVAKKSFKIYFEKIHKLMKPNGSLIITDCSRRNFFNDLGLKSPLMPTIDWEKHQSPETWIEIIEEAGFEKSNLKWSTPNSLGAFGQSFLSSRLVAYFTLSHFRIVSRKREETHN